MNGAPERRRRASFALRLMLALAFAVVAVGIAQYTAVERTLTGTVTDALENAHAADAAVLSELHDDPERGMAAVTELLGHIASRPGVEHVVLIAPDGARSAIGGAAHSGGGDHGSPAPAGSDHARAPATGHEMGPGGTMAMPDADAPAQDVMPAQGRSGAAVETAGQIIVSVPVELDGRAFTLRVHRDDADLRASVHALRRVLLLTLAGGLLLVLPLFYVVGGRALVSSHRQAVEGSVTDGLTGLGNHRLLHEDLRAAVGTAARHGRPLTLAMVDLDGFKQVNDTHGHARGDQVLSAVPAVLRAGRHGDRAYRIGGDEFALLLAETDLTGALEVAERVRSQVEREVDAVTTSIGIAALGGSSPTAPSLLAAADDALYAAKAAGKNAIVTGEPRRKRAVVPA